MPLFEFICKKCSEKFETLVLYGENAESVKCPKCGSNEIIKQFSSFSGSMRSSKCAAQEFCPSVQRSKHKCPHSCCHWAKLKRWVFRYQQFFLLGLLKIPKLLLLLTLFQLSARA